jgi:hypothetical protein
MRKMGRLMTFKVEINVDGFNEARRSAAIQADLRARGERIAAAAGGASDYSVQDAPSKTRARVIVATATTKARHEEAVNRTLLGALDAGRG